MAFWTYRLHCRGGAFYVGHTDALEHRIAQHQAGVEALAMERRVKGWTRAKKMVLLRGDWDASADSPEAEAGRAFDKLRPNGLG